MFRSGAYPLTHESGCHEYRERVKNRALAREISSSASETDEGKHRVPGTRGAPRTATSPSWADRAARLRSRSGAINGARAHPSGSLAGPSSARNPAAQPCSRLWLRPDCTDLREAHRGTRGAADPDRSSTPASIIEQRVPILARMVERGGSPMVEPGEEWTGASISPEPSRRFSQISNMLRKVGAAMAIYLLFISWASSRSRSVSVLI